MAADLYLVRLDECPLNSIGRVLTICNCIVQQDRSRVFHEFTIMTDMIYPPYRLPRKVRKNLTRDAADKLAEDLMLVGAVASVVEQQ